MPKISLTDLVDIASMSGAQKAAKVQEIKNRPGYRPATDFYKPIREHLIDVHKADEELIPDVFLKSITDQRKQKSYPGVIAGYMKWRGDRKLSWFDPPSAIFGGHGIEVRIGPELGLYMNGEAHLVKLYFKTTPLPKERAETIANLMEVALRPQCNKGLIMSVLDLRTATLLSPVVPLRTLTAALDAELAYVAALWDAI